MQNQQDFYALLEILLNFGPQFARRAMIAVSGCKVDRIDDTILITAVLDASFRKPGTS